MPAGVFTYAVGLADRLDTTPDWFDPFVTHLAARYSPSEARARLRDLGRLLPTTPTPDKLVAAAHHPDGRISPLSRALGEFFAAHHILDTVDDTQTRATRHRTRIIDTIPEPLRPTVTAFSNTELANRERARRTGAKPRSDHTLAIHLDVIADFARTNPHLTDWATVAETDIETFLATRPGTHILGSLRGFFAWARSNRHILHNPTLNIRPATRRSFVGPVVDLPRQRELFQRWTTDPTVSPNEATIGLLCLLHACSVNELRHLYLTDVHPGTRTLTIEGRAQPTPLDPSTWTAIANTITYRSGLHTANPHLLVNRRTKTTNQPISPAHPHELLEHLNTTPQRLRCTRLAQLATTVDPILVAELFGLTPKAVLYYLGDTVDDSRLPHEPATPPTPTTTR